MLTIKNQHCSKPHPQVSFQIYIQKISSPLLRNNNLGKSNLTYLSYGDYVFVSNDVKFSKLPMKINVAENLLHTHVDCGFLFRLKLKKYSSGNKIANWNEP